MSIEIVWPEKLMVTDAVIERMYLQALADGAIPPAQGRAKTPAEMAKVLDDIGLIRLQTDADTDKE